MSDRHFMERLVPFNDKSGNRYEVRADLVDGKRPAVSIKTGFDVVVIDVDDWSVVADCVQRGIDTIGDHADDPST